MAAERREALVIVERGDFDAAVEALRAVGLVTQVLPPRLALVAPPPDWTGPGPAVAGVAWYEDDVPDEVVAGLSERERLFVAAWRSRAAGKVRPGDHLPWDAPGRLPPDGPPRERPGGN
ncbi:MAG TPA: hypothetical protein VFI47_02060 [Acidimicrobiales bacterium]|nr:hypothetical protein [Acidimicrobiales bacterium]